MSDISPQQVRSATFRTTRKGFDPDEVTTFLRATAEALEVAQNQSAAMEARARAAVARLQELSGRESPPAPAPSPAPSGLRAPPDEAETISRTLLLAQRTADQTVAEARAEADRVLAAARAEAESTIDSTREMSARLIDEARVEARAATDSDRRAAEGEVMALLARRDFLVADVDHLERFLVEQRERIRDAAAELTEICDRVPAGLAGVRRPLLSAAADAAAPGVDQAVGDRDLADEDDEDLDDEDDDTAEHPVPGFDADETGDDDTDVVGGAGVRGREPDELVIAPVDEGWPSTRSGATETGADAATMAAPTVDDRGRGSDEVEAIDVPPAVAEPQLSFDAADLRRLGETRRLD